MAYYQEEGLAMDMYKLTIEQQKHLGNCIADAVLSELADLSEPDIEVRFNGLEMACNAQRTLLSRMNVSLNTLVSRVADLEGELQAETRLRRKLEDRVRD